MGNSSQEGVAVMSKTVNCREELIDELSMYLVSQGIDGREARDELYVILDKYEITSRSTELAELHKDRNEYLLKKFLIAKTVKGCTRETLRRYKDDLTRILWKIGKTVDDITADDIRVYLALRQKKDGISKRTADTELRYLRTFFQYLVADELVTKNPTSKIERIKCERCNAEVFSDIEVEKIRNATTDERESAVVETLFSTGCRVTELVGIRLDEIEGNKVLVHGKGEKDRIVYLNAKAQVAIEKYLKKRSDNNPYLFAGGTLELNKGGKLSRGKKRKDAKSWWKDQRLVTDKAINKGSIESMTRKIAKRAGIERANPHKFRKTCATMALRRGMSIEQVSKMLGHEQISTTQIYLDLQESELEQAHKKYVI